VKNLQCKFERLLTLIFVLGMGCILATAQHVQSDSPAKLISAPVFSISPADEAAGIDGTIKVNASVDKSGNVIAASATGSPAWPCKGNLTQRVNAVMREAEKAVLKFRFSPEIKDGKPVGIIATLTLGIGKTARENVGEWTPTQPYDSDTKDFVPGKALVLPKPRYPKAPLTGTVHVRILIDEKGEIESAQALDGLLPLQFPAREAACGAKYSPSTVGGSPVKITGKITFNFVP
jgi:hypothetical protein